MKANKLFICAILANLAQLLLCFLYSGGGPLLLALTIPVQLLIFLINKKAGSTWPQVILLGVIHLVITICTAQIYGWLYFNNIHYDLVGEAIMFGITLISAGSAALLWVTNIVIFAYRHKKAKGLGIAQAGERSGTSGSID